MRRFTLAAASFAVLAACSSSGDAIAHDGEADNAATAQAGLPFATQVVHDFGQPWAMTFLPSGELLVTEKTGELTLLNVETGAKGAIAGVPDVAYGGQGGLGDIVLAPDFSTSRMVYLSWIEPGEDDTRGAVVGRAKLVLDGNGGGALQGMEKIWTQYPKVTGEGHYSHRIAFSPDGKYLFIGSGERQKFDPAQDMDMNLGKIVRLYPDGSVPEDNPFVGQADGPDDVTAQIWTLGHRNILGLAFDSEGRLWNQEMGPRHGDELNLVVRGDNYGYPIVSNGDHYDGREIPDHDTRPEFHAPATYWVPAISPAGLMFYSGDAFPAWKGSAFIGGLSSKALVRVTFDGTSAKEAERWDMDARIREIEQGPDGTLWVLEDGNSGSQGRLLHLTPKG